MLKNDRWIKKQAAKGMIEPFVSEMVRKIENGPAGEPLRVLSYGAGSYGYDLRLSPKDFLIFRHVPGTVMNPKRFNAANLEPVRLQHDEDGSYFILPAHSYGLGVALEKHLCAPWNYCKYHASGGRMGGAPYPRIQQFIRSRLPSVCL
jgi:dCTP deaminase